jgi:hypothetical protein
LKRLLHNLLDAARYAAAKQMTQEGHIPRDVKQDVIYGHLNPKADTVETYFASIRRPHGLSNHHAK